MPDSLTPEHASDESGSFFPAIKSGDLEMVRRIAAESPGVLLSFDPDEFEATPLNLAVGRRNKDMVNVLLELGADPNRKSKWWAGGFRPLHFALESGDTETADLLIDGGAEIDIHAASALGDAVRVRSLLKDSPWLVHERAGDGQTPLHYAGTVEVARLLLDSGARVDTRDIDHFGTAAQWQVSRRPEVARYLIERGAKTDVFMLAALGLNAELNTLLDETPNLLHSRITSVTFPSHGSEGGHIYVYTIGEGLSPLGAALRGEQLETADMLLSRGANIHERGGYDNGTLLHFAAWENRCRAAEWLVDHGAELEARSGDMHDNTPLGWAIVGGSADVVDLLLKRGAIVEEQHRKSAESGARGEFIHYSGKPLENYGKIRHLVAG